MSNEIFKIAVNRLLEIEGGFVNHKDDPGGPTNFGISLRFLKSLDEYKHADIRTIMDLSREEVIALYEKYFWKPNNYDQINNPIIAMKLLDMCVNMGQHWANKLAQRAVRAVSGNVLKEDGIIGPQSILEINMCASNAYIAVLKAECANYYRNIKNEKMEKGWLERAYKC